MKLLSLLGLVGLLASTGCMQPVVVDSFADSGRMVMPFHNEYATGLDVAWTHGEVTGVTPEHYSVRLDRKNATTEGGSVRFEGTEQGVYHTIWDSLLLEEDREAAYLMEITFDQHLCDDTVVPLVWARLEQDGRMLSMVDTRAQERTTPGTWEGVVFQVAVPVHADSVTVGVGMMGSGVAQFDNFKVRLQPPLDMEPASQEAKTYLEEFLAVVEADAMRKDNVDWVQMHKDMASLTRGAVTTADTYPALHFCLDALGDRHSRLLTPAYLTSLDSSGGSAAPGKEGSAGPGITLPKGERLEGDLGYLWLPGILSFDDAGLQAYASSNARALEELQDCRGFVIDLRQDGGGNMWPMLAGLGPLLGAEVVGSFRYPDGTQDDWWWRDGQSGQADIPCTRVDPPHASTFPDDIPLAILPSRGTGSSGEATLVAFLGRPNVRTFGQATAGLSTGNSTIDLTDGAILLLTTSVYADRTGKLYGQAIEPDVPVPTWQGEGEDEALVQAQAWLRQAR